MLLCYERRSPVSVLVVRRESKPRPLSPGGKKGKHNAK